MTSMRILEDPRRGSGEAEVRLAQEEDLMSFFVPQVITLTYWVIDIVKSMFIAIVMSSILE